MNTAKKAPGRAGRGAFFSLRYQMMIVFCVVVALVLGLVWFISAQLLQPLYNRHIYQYLNTQVDRLAAMIEACDAPVSYRAFAFSDAVKNDEFWASVDEADTGSLGDHGTRHVIGSRPEASCDYHDIIAAHEGLKYLLDAAIIRDDDDLGHMDAHVRELLGKQGSMAVLDYPTRELRADYDKAGLHLFLAFSMIFSTAPATLTETRLMRGKSSSYSSAIAAKAHKLPARL